MPRKRYTQKGLDTLRHAQERHHRLERERLARSIGFDPLEAAAALTALSPDFQAADLIVGCEFMLEDVSFDEATGEGRR